MLLTATPGKACIPKRRFGNPNHQNQDSIMVHGGLATHVLEPPPYLQPPASQRAQKRVRAKIHSYTGACLHKRCRKPQASRRPPLQAAPSQRPPSPLRISQPAACNRHSLVHAAKHCASVFPLKGHTKALQEVLRDRGWRVASSARQQGAQMPEGFDGHPPPITII